MKDAILNGEFANAKLSTATKNKLNRINGYFDQLTLLYDLTLWRQRANLITAYQFAIINQVAE